MTTSYRTCPDVGAWRAWLDHEDRPADLGEHLQTCPGCQHVLADLRQSAAEVHDTLSLLDPTRSPSSGDIALARERFYSRRRQAVVGAAGSAAATPIRRMARLSTRWRVGASGLAAGIALALIVAFTPQGGAAAASFLAQFRSQQVAPVEITPQTQGQIIQTMNALGNLGTITSPGQTGPTTRPGAALRGAAEQVRTVTLAEASQAVGFAMQTPDPAALPAGFDKAPEVRVMPGSQVRFTFDKARAQSYFQSTGHADVNVPDKYDGATLVVSIPTAAVLEYRNTVSKDAVIVGQAGELVVDVEGGKVTLPEMRDFLLSLPGLPTGVVNQLKQIQNWNETLPIPVPVDQVHWQTTTIHGNEGLLLNDNSGAGSAAIWHAGGHLYGVAGSVKANDLKRVADGMAVH